MIDQLSEGTRDLIIVGPDFARKVLIGLEVGPRSAMDLGDIEVTRGFSIRGKVVDSKGNAVGAALVKVMQGVDAGGTLANLVQGNISSTTDATGEYTIRGFSIVNMGRRTAQVSVFAKNGDMSLIEYVVAGSHTLDFQVSPAGSIEGTVQIGNTDLLLMVTPVTRPNNPFKVSVKNGSYTVRVPEGDYDLSLFPMSGAAPPNRKRVTIVAGTNTIVNFP